MGGRQMAQSRTGGLCSVTGVAICSTCNTSQAISSTLCFNFPVYNTERMQAFSPPKPLIICFKSDCRILRSQSEDIKVPETFTTLITKVIHNFIMISSTRRPFFPVLANIQVKSQLLSSLTMSQLQLRGYFPLFIPTCASFSLFSFFFAVLSLQLLKKS